MSTSVDIRPRDLATVRLVLNSVLPDSARVWVFGSRATGAARRGSDLDLAIEVGRPIKPREAAALAEAFDACELPYTVDIVDLADVGERFGAIIEQTRVPLPATD